jgi:hypothetical protein
VTGLRNAVSILRNRTDLIVSRPGADQENLGAIWEAIDMVVDAIERPGPSISAPRFETAPRSPTSVTHR